MGKLIGKTVAITLAAIVGLFAVVFGLVTLIKPVAIADMLYNAGLNDAALSFYEMQYNKTGSAEDLGALVTRFDAEKGGVKETEYAYALIFCDDFDSYVSSREKDFGGKEKTYEFFFDKYLLSLSVTGVTEYGVNNPVRRILDEKGDVITDKNLKLMQAFLTGLKEKEENAENDVLAEDLERINSLLGE